MENLIFGIFTFILIYLMYLIFVINKKSKLEKMKKGNNVLYLVNKYKLNLKKIDIKKLTHAIAFANSFILSVTVFIIGYIENIYLKIIICFPILLILEFITYFIIGRIFKDKEKRN